MMTYFIIAILIILVGVLCYFTSAWFGMKPSNTDKMPPHYAHLLRHLQEKQKPDKAANDTVNEYEIVNKR